MYGLRPGGMHAPMLLRASLTIPVTLHGVIEEFGEVVRRALRTPLQPLVHPSVNGLEAGKPAVGNTAA